MVDKKDIPGKNKVHQKDPFSGVIKKLDEGHEGAAVGAKALWLQQVLQHRSNKKQAHKDAEEQKEILRQLTKVNDPQFEVDGQTNKSLQDNLNDNNFIIDFLANIYDLAKEDKVDREKMLELLTGQQKGIDEGVKLLTNQLQEQHDAHVWTKKQANEAERLALLGTGGAGTGGTGGGGDGTGGAGGDGKGGGWAKSLAAGALATAAILKGASGLAMMGLAISAFFGGLYLGDKTLEWLDADLKFSKIKEAAEGFVGITEVLTPTAMIALGGLMAIPAIGGMSAAKGVGAMGFAISAFFVGLLAGDKLLEGYTALGGTLDFPGYTKLVKGFNDVIAGMSKATMIVMGTLITAGAGLGFVAGKGGGLKVIAAALGVAAIGASISALFIGLAAGSALIEGTVLSDFTDLTGIKAVIGSLGDILAQLDEKTLAALGVLILGGAGLGAMSKNPVGAGLGVAALGFGIAGLFIGLAGADKTMAWMNTDFTATTKAMKGFSDAMGSLSWTAIAALTTLLGAGGVLGVVTNEITKTKFVLGIGALSAGIAAFFLSFSGIDWVAAKIGEGGSAKKLITNFGEAIDALSGKTLTTLGVLMGSSVIAGMFLGATATAVPAIALIGTGIAAFFLAFDGMSKVADIIGVDGSSTKKLIENMAGGLASLNAVDGANLKKVGIGLFELTGGMAAFFSAKGIGAIYDFIIGDAVDVLSGWYRKFFPKEGEPSIIENMVEMLMPIQKLNDVDLSGFNTAVGNLSTFTDIKWEDSADDFKIFVDKLLKNMPRLDKLFDGNLSTENLDISPSNPLALKHRMLLTGLNQRIINDKGTTEPVIIADQSITTPTNINNQATFGISKSAFTPDPTMQELMAVTSA